MFEVAVLMCDLKRQWDGNFGTSEVVGGKTPHCLGEFHWRQGTSQAWVGIVFAVSGETFGMGYFRFGQCSIG